MVRALSRLRYALWLPLVLAVGCQPVREDRSINFQTNGDQVAFQHGSDGIFIADQHGGPPTKIFQPAADVVATSTPLWSPTDKRLIFTTAKKAADMNIELHLGGEADPAGKLYFETPILYTCWLREEPKDGKAPEPVALFQAHCCHPGYVAANLGVRWHPDGKHLLFVKQTSLAEHAVFEFDLETRRSRQVFHRTAPGIVFDWAPDHRHLVCILGGNKKPRDTDGIWIGTPLSDDWWQVPQSTALAQGELPAILEQLRATRPIWSRQGDRFVFASAQIKDALKNESIHPLYLATLATHSVTKLLEGSQRPRDIHWSPAGERLGYIAGAEEGPLTFVRVADQSSSTLVPSARAFVGWDEKNASLAYVTADPVPHQDGAEWVFLLTPNPQYRDALWLAPADGSSPGEKVFSGMQVTFPQWAAKESKVSLWATFNPSYRSWSSGLFDYLAFMARLDELSGQSSSINLNNLRVRPGDPALLLNPENGALDWKAINPHEQLQLGHYYLLKHDYTTAWQWYDQANQTARAEEVREALFFQYYCLAKLHRDNEAREKLSQFQRDFWPKLPEAPNKPKENGPTAAEFIRTLADPQTPQGQLVQDLYIAEVFLSLDAAADGENYFRAELKNATSDTMRLNKALVLAQFLLLTKKYPEYLDLASTTLLPLFLDHNALPAAAAANRDDNPLTQLGSYIGPQLAILPLCDPAFARSLEREQSEKLLARLQELRNRASRDRQRLWLDVMLHATHQALGQTMQTGIVARRIADNPEVLDAQHGKDAVALIGEVRLSAAAMLEFRKMVQWFP